MSIRFTAAVAIALAVSISVFGQDKPSAPAPAIRISGRLLDSDGSPLEGASVAVKLHEPDSTGSLAIQESVTDRNGRFEFRCAAFKKYDLGFEAGDKRMVPKLIDAKGTDVNIGDPRLDSANSWSVPFSKLTLPGIKFVNGRLLDPTGLPIVSAKITLRFAQSTGSMDETATDAGGWFILSCMPSRTHVLGIDVKGLKPVQRIFKDCGSKYFGYIYMQGSNDWPNPDYKGNLRLDQIVVVPENKAGDWLSWRKFDRAIPDSGCQPCRSCPTVAENWYRAGRSRESTTANDRSIESFIGGKVRQIRVVRVAGSGYISPAERELVRQQVRRVWFSMLRPPSPGIMWAEATNWNVEAMVDFEDGQHISIWMDDWMHVKVQDRDCRVWFARLKPAVD
jgi:hypothetical protein